MRNRIDQFLLGGMAILLVGFVLVLANSLNEHMVKEGDTAAPFTIRTDTGKTVSASNFGGNLLILNFWASWCKPCIDEVPSLDRLQHQFADKGLVVLGISIDKDAGAYRGFLRRNPVSFLTARQTTDAINVEYGTLKVPETYIIDRSGKVLKKIIGEENWGDENVVSYVQSLL